uniref:Uncharacterized protein n=1 Tax=viral metagenome TaxID=1070528 RepID=A0A6C0EUR2_9ZZZZ
MWKAPIYRKSYKKKYGSKCFLNNLKYPICSRGKIDCKGLRAAAYYARLQNNKKILNKTKKIYKKYKC